MIENWKPIAGWEKYEVSDHGRVRSWCLGPEPHIKKLNRDRSGHLRVHFSRDNRTKAYFVHRLVAEAFIGPAPEGHTDCAHLDGNPANNHVSNLKWTTRAENLLHKREHGTMIRGEKSHLSVMTDAKVISLRREFKNGDSLTKLAKRYGISATTASKIVKGITWAHVAVSEGAK